VEWVVSKEEARQAVADARREGRTIAFVPTMGALHEGHLSLVRAAARRASYVAVSIFVNPAQFGPHEDFDAYPRDLAGDAGLLRAEGVDLLFAPTTEGMYGDGDAALDTAVKVDPGALATVWEGSARPSHFIGVATIVTKLFGVVRPDLAFFGEKDFQQFRIIERVVRDLDIPAKIVSCPVVRDRDGLALSSRNVNLNAIARGDALALYAAISAAGAAVAAGERSASVLKELMTAEFDSRPGIAMDYAVIVDPYTLEELTAVDRPARVLVAGRVGQVRLIDTAPIVPPRGSR